MSEPADDARAPSDPPAADGGPAARVAAAAAAVPREALGAHVARQRWSGARGAEVRVSAVTGVPLFDAPPAAALLVDAEVAGASARYFLPVAERGAAGASPLLDAAPGLTDGVHDAACRAALLAALAGGSSVTRRAGAGLRVTFEPAPDAAPTLTRAGAAGTSRVIGGEQSNTSIVYGDAVILKLFRRLEAGEHPDVEVTRALTRRGFAHTPRLLGVIVVEEPEGTSVVGMAQALVAGATDAWAHAVERARAFVDGPSGAENPYLADAAQVGAVTRALHDALATPPAAGGGAGGTYVAHAADDAFVPRRAAREVVDGWAHHTRESVRAGVALLAERLVAGALDGLPADARAVARDVAGRSAHVLAAVDRAAAAARDDGGAAVRHHGDYHLGQLLRGADGALYVIDFEGEPSRPLEARRAHHSALRDVAGMLRSFAYAAATARLSDHPARAAATAGAADVRASRAARWEADARAAFLAAYFDAPPGASPAAARDDAYLPSVRAHADALTTMFEIEKLFYELAYELRNRPDWVTIPLLGVARVLGAAAPR